MFHLASTIVGGRDLIEEFVAAKIWTISHGWPPQRNREFQRQLGKPNKKGKEKTPSDEPTLPK
jgi:hypothetical protein